MKPQKYTQEEFLEACRLSKSKRGVLLRLGVAAYGGNYNRLNNLLETLNVDTSHFTGQAWASGISKDKRPIEDYLSNQKQITSHRMRLRLISDGVMQAECSHCNLSEWLGGPIPLELDHINGNNKDNTLSNLRLLCPNCHALTPNYRGKNKSSKA